MTPNQLEFYRLQQKVFRWQEYAEKQGLDTLYFFPEKPDRITKQFLKDLKSEIPTKRWQFLEQYGITETGENYVRPISEKIKATQAAKKGWKTRRGDNEQTSNSEVNEDVNENDISERQKAYNYIIILISEFDSGCNTDLMQEFERILLDFINYYASDEDCKIFNKNYEENKGVIDSDFSALNYDSGNGDILTRYTNEVLDLLFSETSYNPDLTMLRAIIEEMSDTKRHYSRRKSNK